MIKTFSILCCLFWLNAIAYNPGPESNDYAHNPITPGYGISDYFELVPKKVSTVRESKHQAPRSLPRLRTISTPSGIYLQLSGFSNGSSVKISLFSLNGRCIMTKIIRPTLNNLTIAPENTRLSSGYYLVQVKQIQHTITTGVFVMEH